LTISIKSVNNIAACKAVWDDFLPEVHHLNERHLLQIEKANIPDIENHYLQIFLKNKLIGIAYLQLFKFNHTHVSFNTPPTIQSRLLKFFLPKSLQLLVCGNLFRIDFQGFYFKNEQHNACIFEAINLFTKQNKRLNPYGIIVKDCKDVFLAEKYASSGYYFFNGDVTMEITRRQDWHTFEDYLNDLTKKYFKRAKKIMLAFDAVQTKELNATEILENSSEIERLYLNVVNKQKIRLGIVNAAYLYELKYDLGHDFELHALYFNNIMIGFYTYIFYNNEMETHYIGLDYSYNNSHKIYFNILFLSVKKMIERKFEKLELGRTAKEAKANLGAFPKQIFNYVKVNNLLAKIAMQYFLKKFNRSENQLQSERSPLK
jgi:hypothetical protein